MQFSAAGAVKYKTEQTEEAAHMNRWRAFTKFVTKLASVSEWSASLS